MTSFSGFPDGKMHLTPIPEPFFRELLPQIDQLAELKLAVYVFWRLDRMDGAFRYLRWVDIASDEAFMLGLGATSQEAQEILQRSLTSLVERGFLLAAVIHVQPDTETLYFLNSARGRAAVQAIERGEWRYSGDSQQPVELPRDIPNIYKLYEQNIGPLTPMIADALREAEETYPDQWIEDAVRIAVENNARSWRYVEAILERWQQEGRDERKDRRDTEKDRRRYIEGEYADYIEH